MKPLILAHRGASGYAPENTMKAFDLAFKQQADGVEMDVFLTTDKHVVITHDDELSRLTGQKLITCKQNLATLKQLDFGQGEKIPTLAEFFDTFGKKFPVINVEIKSTGLRTNGIEQAVLQCIRQFKLEEQVTISSFNPMHLIRMRKIAPEIKRGYLVWPPQKMAHRDFWITRAQPQTMNLPVNWLTPQRFQKYSQDKKIWLWDVDFDPTLLQKWLDHPIEAIITNFPDQFKK